MGYCKSCFDEISNDCLLTNEVCVFCYYKTNEWETNGQVVKRRDSIKKPERFFIEWHDYYKEYYNVLQTALFTLKKGSICPKIIGKQKYYYLAYRKGKKVIFEYIGRVIPSSLIEQLQLRKKVKRKILQLKSLLFTLKVVPRPHYNKTRLNRFRIFKKDDFKCRYCGKRAPQVELQLDHIIPISKGGTNEETNLTTVCEKCNTEKGAMLLCH